MAKRKTSFFCQNCGAQSAKWIGKCPSCGEWNTYVEEVIENGSVADTWRAPEAVYNKNKPLKLDEIVSKNEQRVTSGDGELDRVLGGGIVEGSLVLIGGEPGIGKSTLMLQVALMLKTEKILYVSGEESLHQIKMRAERMKGGSEALLLFAETSLEKIFDQIKKIQPNVVVIDSIQTIFSDLIESTPGSISQVRHCAGELMKYAKISNVPVFIIGHITKDGTLAGPKILEHMVDTVIHFEGDRHHAYRILRTTKNRFGSTSELGIYEMQGSGLRQVSNPSEILISQRDSFTSGVAIGATVEGNRPLLIETQSLVSPATYGNPQRVCTGFDLKRLNMLLAVLEKRAGFRLGTQDVFLNIAGGLKIDDPAIDLAVGISIISSYNDLDIPNSYCFAAEIGLSGEIRAVNKIESRIAEAEKLGFKNIVVSKFNKISPNGKRSINVLQFGKLSEVISDLMG